MTRLPLGHRRAAAARYAVSCLGALLFLVGCAPRDASPPIILIVVDTLRYDFLGVNGFQGDVSPTIDKMGGESWVFSRCYAQAPWTKPSIASLFTSLNPSAHGVIDHEGRIHGQELSEEARRGVLQDKAITLAEAMVDRGYATAAFVANPWLTHPYGYHQGFQLYVDDAIGHDIPAEQLLNGAVKWIGEQPIGSPYFVYIHVMDVHGPYLAPKSAFSRQASSSYSTRRLSQNEMDSVPQNLRMGEWKRDQAGDLGEWHRRYATGVRYFDDQLLDFMAKLEDADVLDHAFVVLTSDHGEEFMEHNGWEHGKNLYQHQLHVPLIIRPPRGLSQGKAVDVVVRLIDLKPTLLDWTGLPMDTPRDGVSLAPLLKDRPMPPVTSFACGSTFDPGLASLTFDTYKVIVNTRLDTLAVFDLLADPWEQMDLAPENPLLARDLAEEIREHVLLELRRDLFSPTLPDDGEHTEKLRSLGYLQ